MYFDFANGLPKDYVYAIPVAVPYRVEFLREADGIGNQPLPASIAPGKFKDFGSIPAGVLRKGKLPLTMGLVCNFETNGAPLVVSAEDMHTITNAEAEYGNYVEGVLYEGGINMWQLDYIGNGERKVTNPCRAKLPFPEKAWTNLHIEVRQSGIRATAGELVATCACSLPESVWTELMACENINHFRSMEIQVQ